MLAVLTVAVAAPPGLALVPDPLLPPGAHWAVDPAVPGPDLPPVGRSLFDHLVAAEGGPAVALVSFDALRSRIEARVQRDASAGVPGLKQVLIPLGRSLQRTAAAPDFFGSPRIVLAVDEEPSRRPGEPVMLLKDRLFLGYQPKAAVLEVISWNEAAGRFEFQVVKDLRPGGSPRVFQANRELCVACHQNAGPIFSLAGWDETNANARVAAALRARAASFLGVAVGRGVDVPNAIDDSTDRANRFAAVQRLWRDGCGADDAQALDCRAGLFVAALQFRLSGDRQFDRGTGAYRNAQAVLAVRGRAVWPGGLALGNADLPDRDPLALRNEAQQLDVAAPFDPLLARPPLEVWPADDAATFERTVAGLSTFIAASDIERLDAHLRSRGARTYRRFEATCRVETAAAESRRERVAFDCAGSAVEAPLSLRAEIEWRAGTVAEGSIARLRLGAHGELRGLRLQPSALQGSGGRRTVRFALRSGALGARAADGNAIESLELSWSGEIGNAAVRVADDFTLVEDTVAAMRQASQASEERRFDGFDAKPFRRVRLVGELLDRLGASRTAWCCLDDSSLPAMAFDDVTPAPSAPRGAAAPDALPLASFYRHCSACHLTPDAFPPNFLAGNAAQVERNLAHCAERLYVRMTMWRHDPGGRAKTPMPPVQALRRAGYSETEWRNGFDLAQMLRSVAGLLQKQTGRAPDPALLARSYETLKACLPAPAN